MFLTDIAGINVLKQHLALILNLSFSLDENVQVVLKKHSMLSFIFTLCCLDFFSVSKV